MNDVDRWVHLEGPEPQGVRELLDAGGVPDLSPEEQERLDRELLAAIAEDRRRRTWRRRMKPALGGLLLAACVACAVPPVLKHAGRRAHVRPRPAGAAAASAAPLPAPGDAGIPPPAAPGTTPGGSGAPSR